MAKNFNEIDLTKIEGTEGYILRTHHYEIDKLTTARDIYYYVKDLFEAEHLDTKASRKMLNDLYEYTLFNNYPEAIKRVWNCIMSAAGEGVNSRRANQKMRGY